MSLLLPTGFMEGLPVSLPGDEREAFRQALDQPPPVSLQLNPAKPTQLPYPSDPVPWYPQGRYLPERPTFTADPTFHAGAYYVQEAGSMFIGHLAARLLPPGRPWKILDLCAAPGGKSCLLAAVAPPGSLLVSNEIIRSRYAILNHNLAKWGMDNCWTTNLDPERFADLGGFFDLVLVDAPCSGEGLFRKDPKAREEWSPEAVAFCALRQERILRAATPLVAPDGLLLYSTCTYNERENEQHATLLNDRGFRIEQPDLPAEWGVVAANPGYHFFPHRLRSEGFYALAARATQDHRPKKYRSRPFPHLKRVAQGDYPKISRWLRETEAYDFLAKKSGQLIALNKKYRKEAEIIAATLGRLDFGLPMGEIKGRELVPDPALAFSTQLSPEISRFEVDRQTALRLLKRETPPIPVGRGRQLITHRKLGLLWVKGLGNRYNNNYPIQWRIRMDLP